MFLLGDVGLDDDDVYGPSTVAGAGVRTVTLWRKKRDRAVEGRESRQLRWGTPKDEGEGETIEDDSTCGVYSSFSSSRCSSLVNNPLKSLCFLSIGLRCTNRSSGRDNSSKRGESGSIERDEGS